MATEFEIRDAIPGDREAITAVLMEAWGSTTIVSHGQTFDASRLPALVAAGSDGELVGLLTLSFWNSACEIVTLNATYDGHGIGTALLEQAAIRALASGCMRLWLITSNDNIAAIRFYQRRGMRIVAVNRGAVDRAREIKPSIPLVGDHGIPVHDELEFELQLSADQSA